MGDDGMRQLIMNYIKLYIIKLIYG